MSADPDFRKKDFQALVDEMLADLRRPTSGRVRLSDAHEGSVVRTLVEVFSRELALAYEQLERIYRMGYLDTAQGQALEQVVALLGLTRRPAGWLEGLVTFSRATPAPADIPIPAGTVVAGEKTPEGVVPPLCRTTIRADLAQGSTAVTVPVRSVAPYSPPASKGGQGAARLRLTFIPRPLNGIERVESQGELRPGLEAETDDELRERARHAVDAASAGTLMALKTAVAGRGYAEVKVEERGPGVVEVLVGAADGSELDEDDLREIRDAVDEARPAGVQVTARGTQPLSVRVAATLVLDGERSEAEKRDIESAARRGLEAYFAQRQIGESVRWTAVRNLLGAHPLVLEVSPAAFTSETPREAYPLRPFLRGGDPSAFQVDQFIQVDPATGDVVTSVNQRVRLDAAPLQLKLEPAALAVLVDVEILLDPGDAVAVEQRREQLRGTCSDALKRLVPGTSFSLAELKKVVFREDLPGSVIKGALTFTFIHSSDSRVRELQNPGDTDILREREAPRLRYLKVEKGAGGV